MTNLKLYQYKGNVYQFVSEGRLKINGEWVDAVVYCATYMPYDGDYFIRLKHEFYELFELHPAIKTTL